MSALHPFSEVRSEAANSRRSHANPAWLLRGPRAGKSGATFATRNLLFPLIKLVGT